MSNKESFHYIEYTGAQTVWSAPGFIKGTIDDAQFLEGTVRVSRITLVVLIALTGLLLLVGLDIYHLHNVFDASTLTAEAGKTGVRIAGYVFLIIIPLIVILKQIQLLFRPPVMLGVLEKGITFGTGFGYHPYFVPWSMVESVGTFSYFMGLSVRVQFRSLSQGLLSGAATSAGIRYGNYELALHRLYYSGRSSTIADHIRSHLTPSA